MSVNALLEEFKVKAATPKQQLAEYKAQGKKVVGVLPYYAPEELVYAADGNLGLQQQDDQPCKRVLRYFLLHHRSVSSGDAAGWNYGSVRRYYHTYYL